MSKVAVVYWSGTGNTEEMANKVADGAKVRKGDVLIEADLDAIKAAGHPATTMMILTNADDFSKVEKTAAGTVTTADLAMKIEK